MEELRKQGMADQGPPAGWRRGRLDLLFRLGQPKGRQASHVPDHGQRQYDQMLRVADMGRSRRQAPARLAENPHDITAQGRRLTGLTRGDRPTPSPTTDLDAPLPLTMGSKRVGQTHTLDDCFCRRRPRR